MPSGITVRAAGDSFLDSIGSPNTRRAYGIAVDKTTATLGETRRLADVADDEIGETLETLWGSSAVNTWNARRAAVASWLAWCREHGHTAPAVPAWVKRSTPPDSTTPVHSRTAISGSSPAATSTSGRRRCGGCSTKPAPAPRNCSRSTSRTSIWPGGVAR